jgi:hypothetical protein
MTIVFISSDDAIGRRVRRRADRVLAAGRGGQVLAVKMDLACFAAEACFVFHGRRGAHECDPSRIAANFTFAFFIFVGFNAKLGCERY